MGGYWGKEIGRKEGSKEKGRKEGILSNDRVMGLSLYISTPPHL